MTYEEVCKLADKVDEHYAEWLFEMTDEETLRQLAKEVLVRGITGTMPQMLALSFDEDACRRIRNL